MQLATNTGVRRPEASGQKRYNRLLVDVMYQPVNVDIIVHDHLVEC